MEAILGIVFGVIAFLLIYCLLGGVYTVTQNERAVVTNFGRTERIGRKTTLDLPIAEYLTPENRERYQYPQIRLIGPGGPYLRLPRQRGYQVKFAIQTMIVALDPDSPGAKA